MAGQRTVPAYAADCFSGSDRQLRNQGFRTRPNRSKVGAITSDLPGTMRLSASNQSNTAFCILPETDISDTTVESVYIYLLFLQAFAHLNHTAYLWFCVFVYCMRVCVYVLYRRSTTRPSPKFLQPVPLFGPISERNVEKREKKGQGKKKK